MNEATMSLFFALLTVATLFGLAALLVIVLGARRSDTLDRMLDWLTDTVGPYGLWLAWAVAAVSMLGSLYYSEIVKAAPCTLCWYQRIAMYPFVVILAIAAVRHDLEVRRYAWPLTAVGGLFALYQYLYQLWPALESPVCGVDAASCAERIVWEFGFVSFPFMSLVAFAAIAALVFQAARTPEEWEAG